MAEQRTFDWIFQLVDRITPGLRRLVGELGRVERAAEEASEAASLQRSELAPTVGVEHIETPHQQSIDKINRSMDKYNEEATEAAQKTRIWSWELFQLSIVAGAALFSITRTLGSFVQAGAEVEANLIGLRRVAQSFGQDVEAAEQAAKDLAEDGLLTLAQSAKALTQLLRSDYTLEEAILIMNRLKDAAAFNRQGMLEFGDAVVGAADGIKNMHGIMIDNAGVTMNLEVMYGLYAAQLGKTANQLTYAEKRQAILNGVLLDTQNMVGNAAILADTYRGALGRLQNQTFMTQAAIGEGLKPVLTDLINLWYGILNAVETLANEHPHLVSGLLLAATAVTGLTVVLTGLRLTLMMAAEGVKQLLLWMGLAQVGTGRLITGILALTAVLAGSIAMWSAARSEARKYQEALEEARRAEHDLTQAMIEELQQRKQALQQEAQERERLQRIREQGEEEERRRIISRIDALYDHLVRALQERYAKERDEALKAVNDKVAALRKEREAEEQLIREGRKSREESYRHSIEIIRQERDERVAAIRAEINAIQELMNQLRERWEEEDRQRQLEDIDRDLAITHDVDRAYDLIRRREEILIDGERDAQMKRLEEQRDALQQQLDELQEHYRYREEVARKWQEQERQRLSEQFDYQMELLDLERQAIIDHYDRLMEGAASQAEMMLVHFDENQQEILELLKTFEPEYFHMGKSFGERLLEGIAGVTPEYQALLIQDISLARNAEELIRQAGNAAVAEAQRIDSALKAIDQEIARLQQRLIDFRRTADWALYQDPSAPGIPIPGFPGANLPGIEPKGKSPSGGQSSYVPITGPLPPWVAVLINQLIGAIVEHTKNRFREGSVTINHHGNILFDRPGMTPQDFVSEYLRITRTGVIVR